MRYLGLDLGMKRTGVAFFDVDSDIVVSLDTIICDKKDALCVRIAEIVAERSIDALVIGYPFLPGGECGAQVQFVRECITLLEGHGLSVQKVDERYSTPRGIGFDKDAAAACAILETIQKKQ